MTTAPTTRARTPVHVWLKATGNDVAELQIIDANFSPALKTALGYVAVAEANNVSANGRQDALKKGLFPVRLAYKRANKTQSVTVLVSPRQADTVGTAALAATYRGGNITAVRPPRRRVFVI